MIEEAIEIRTSDGIADGFLYRAEGAGKLPGAIHLTDIGGIRPSHREMAKRLADKGYTVLMPNVFYRTAKPPIIDIKIGMGDPRTMQRFAELRAPMTPDAVERDGTAYVNFLAAHGSVSAAPIGVVGYCFTGAMAMRTAAAMAGQSCRGRVIPRRRSLHRRADQPASAAAANQGAPLLRTRDQRSQHVDGGDRKVR